jgi:RNA polymerase-interacting CarD/CdnL/TRCF family regulator
MTVNALYSVGDWIVHNHYGVGQIKDIEEKPIHGKDTATYRVKTKDAEYWVPLNNADNPRIRRVVNKRKLRKAMRMLRAKPQKMAKNYKKRNSRIKKVFRNGSIYKMARLLRDLLNLRNIKKLNNTEYDAVEKLTERFEREYAACYDVPLIRAKEVFADYLIEQAE